MTSYPNPTGTEDAEASSASSNGADPTKQTINQLTTLFAELKDYVGYYVGAKLDKVKWSFTKIGVYAALGIVGFLALSAILTTTVVIFLVGLATALGRAFGEDMWWLGWLIVGGVILIGTGVGLWLAISAFLRRSGKTLVERYEAKREAQHARYGHHVRSRAADSAHTV
jgi:hypothetical protein